MRKTYIYYIVLIGITALNAQNEDSLSMQLIQTKVLTEKEDTLTQLRINGQVVSAMITESDTIIVSQIDNVSISSPRRFESNEDYLKYLKYRRYAAKVYPYAKEAIRIFREAEYVSNNMKKRKKKKYLKKLSKELQNEFEAPLKKLSKTQGKILVEMIEKELETSIYDLIKMTRGKMNAFYWNQSSKLYGYRLKEVYEKGQNPILDIVLQDFEISHNVQ